MPSKIKYEDVKKEIESLGWKLVSTSYVNLKTDLEVICPEGHTNLTPFSRLRAGTYECPICKQNEYYKIENCNVKKTGYRVLAFD